MKKKLQNHDLFSLLANPARLELINVIGMGEACVCHLEAATGKRQAFISQHLMVMKKAGIIKRRKEGKFVFYRIADHRLFDILSLVAEFTGQPNPIRSSEHKLIKCDCPKCQEK